MHQFFAVIRNTWFALLLMLAGAAQAAPILWVSDENGNLGRVDAANGAVQLIGPMGGLIYDIAFDPNGNLFAVGDTYLYSIDTATAAATVIGALGTTVNSLAFAADGTLYGANTSLYTINPATGVASEVGNGGTSYRSSGDLAFVGDALYLTGAVAAADDLIRLDPATGAGTVIGSMGTFGVYGLAADDNGALFGVSLWDVFEVDPATGAAARLSTYFNQGLDFAYGATFWPATAPAVPEPSTWALLLGGLALLGATGRNLRYTSRPILRYAGH